MKAHKTLKSRTKLGKGWAWQFPDGETCNWAAPTKEDLIREGIPSPECKPISVYIIKKKDLRVP